MNFQAIHGTFQIFNQNFCFVVSQRFQFHYLTAGTVGKKISEIKNFHEFRETKILLPIENAEENSAIGSTDIQTSQRFLGNISIPKTFGFEIPRLNVGVHGNPKKLM